jgi:O-antigen ligase
VDRLLERGVLALLCLAPLSFGSVLKWSVCLLELHSFLLLALLLVRRLLHGDEPSPAVRNPLAAPLLVALLLFYSLCLIQIIPLPPRFVEVVSPEAYRIHTLLGGGARPGAWRTISIAPYATLQELLLLLSYAAVFTVVAALVRDRARYRRIVYLLVGLAVGMLLLALLQKAFWNGRIYWIYPVDPYLESGSGIWGPYINRNHFAGYLELVIPLALGMLLYLSPETSSTPGAPAGSVLFRFLSSSRLGGRALWGMLSLVLVAALCATLSRGAMIGCLLSFALLTGMAHCRRSLRRRTSLLRLLAILLALVVVAAAWGRLEDRFESLDVQHISRLDAWTDAMGLVRDFPLTGSGLGSFEAAFRRYQAHMTGGIFDHAHNDYLELVTDVGLLGGVPVLAALFLFVASLVARWRRRRGRFVLCLGGGGLCSLAALAVHSFTDFNLRIPANALLAVVIAALTQALLFSVPSEREGHAAVPEMVPLSPRRRLVTLFLLAALLLPVGLALSGLVAERCHASVEWLLDDPGTEELDQVGLKAATASLYAQALERSELAWRLDRWRPLYSWDIAGQALQMGEWGDEELRRGKTLPSGFPRPGRLFGLARRHLELAIAAEPTNPDYHLALAALLEERYRNSRAACRELALGVESFPNSSTIRLATARQHLAHGRQAEAMEQVRALAKVDDSYLLPETHQREEILASRPGWYMETIYGSNLYAAFELAWSIRPDPDLIRSIVPGNREARIVLESFLDQQGIE